MHFKNWNKDLLFIFLMPWKFLYNIINLFFWVLATKDDFILNNYNNVMVLSINVATRKRFNDQST